ncbi:unnamed protein product, partial [Rotaria magnacalcarata]
PSTHASSVLPSSTLLPTTPTYIPTHTPPQSSFATTIPIGSATLTSPSSLILSETLSSSMYWDPSGFLIPPPSQSIIIPTVAPGPVQRPNSSFSPAPGTVNNATSRCIQRPSPEPRSCSTNSAPFPLYSPMNYAVGGNSTSSWSDSSATNRNESSWNYTQESQQLGLSTDSTDFPLYNPFHSGAGLTLPSTTEKNLLINGFSEHYTDRCVVPHDNDTNEMDVLNKEIEDFKKFCFEKCPVGNM